MNPEPETETAEKPEAVEASNPAANGKKDLVYIPPGHIWRDHSLANKINAKVRGLLSVIADPMQAHDVWAIIGQYMPNPDNILTVSGKDNIEFYNSMVDADSHLSGLVNTRMDAVTGLDWEIIPAGEESRDEEIAEWVAEAIDNISEFEDDMEELLGALVTGYSVSEIIWKYDGKYLLPEALLSRRVSRFVFGYDYELRLKTRSDYYGAEVPPNKFIVHRNRKRYENPYGISVCRSVYWPWLFKHQGFQWWIIAAERNAVPTPKASYPLDWDADQQKDLYQALLGFQNDNAITFPEGANLDFFQTKTDPQLNEKLRDACNEEMSWGILGSTHATGTGSKGGGSYALAHEHGTVRQDILERDSRRLQATLNNQLIEPMVLLNFGPQDSYPRIKFGYEPPANREIEMKIISEAVKIGMPVDQNAAAEKLGIKLAAEGDEPIVMPQPSFGGFGAKPQELQGREYNWPLRMK